MNLVLQKCRKKVRNFSNRWKLRRKYKGYVIDEGNFENVEENKNLFSKREYEILKEIKGKRFAEQEFEKLLDVWERELEKGTKPFTDANFHLIFAPLPDFNAMCTNKCLGNLLKDEYLIILNEALVYGLPSLSISLVLLDLVNSEPSFVEYCKNNGIPIKDLPFWYFKLALNHFIHPKENIIHYGAFKGINKDWDDFITNRAANITSKMLNFIIWHECGHILNKDIDISNFYESLIENNNDSVNIELKDIKEKQKKEYRADLYAFQTYLQSVEGDTKAKWIYFSYIYYLFSFLEVAEREKRIQSYTHPPARKRKKFLFRLMNSKYKDQKFDLLLNWIDKDLNIWGGENS